MCRLGLILIDSDVNSAFDLTLDVAYKLFEDKITNISEFVFDVYGIWKPWEREAFSDYVRQRLEQKVFFLDLSDSKSAVFSDMFEKECFEKQVGYFLLSEWSYLESVVYFTLDSTDFRVSILNKDSDKAYIKISKENCINKLEFYNIEKIEQILGVSETDLQNLCFKNDFKDIAKDISQTTGLPFDLFFEEVSKHRRKYKATVINTLD